MVLESSELCRTLASVGARGLICNKRAYLSGTHQPLHTHDNARFVFVLKGSFAESFERGSRSCSPFVVLFRPPHERHSDKYGPGEVVCISVDVALSWLDGLREGGVNLSESAASESGSLSAIAIKLGIELSVPDAASSLAIEALLTEAAVEMARQHIRAGNPHRPPWLERATALIQAEHASNLFTRGRERGGRCSSGTPRPSVPPISPVHDWGVSPKSSGRGGV